MLQRKQVVLKCEVWGENMDLASMLTREDFFPIFFNTIKEYYKQVYGESVEVSFCNKKECNLIIKRRLSAATSPHISAAARSFYYSEWNVRNSLLKYVAAKLGVFFLTHSGKSFAWFTMRMTPERLVNKDLVIVPNNRSIRFFDYKENTVGCMIKEGFTDKYFSNQLKFRKENHYPFMIPLIRYGKRWFIEPIMQGHPLARVVNERAYQKGIEDALSGIRLLAADTLFEIAGCTYVNSLSENIDKLIKNAMERKNIKNARKALVIVKKAADEARKLLKVPMCKSHGDFQSGNIWVDENMKTWIYDWETVADRSVWYDSSVLCYSLRRPFGWEEFYTNPKPYKMLNCDVGANPSEEEYQAMKCLVLLEDVLFYLEDMMELPDKWGSEIFDLFIERLDHMEALKK